MVACTKGRDKPANRPPPKGARLALKKAEEESRVAEEVEAASWERGVDERGAKKRAEQARKEADKLAGEALKKAAYRKDLEDATRQPARLKKSVSSRKLHKSESDLASLWLLELEIQDKAKQKKAARAETGAGEASGASCDASLARPRGGNVGLGAASAADGKKQHRGGRRAAHAEDEPLGGVEPNRNRELGYDDAVLVSATGIDAALKACTHLDRAGHSEPKMKRRASSRSAGALSALVPCF